MTDSAGVSLVNERFQEATDPGALSWTWNGTDSSGERVANGTYYSVITATTDAGTLTHRLPITVSTVEP